MPAFLHPGLWVPYRGTLHIWVPFVGVGVYQGFFVEGELLLIPGLGTGLSPTVG